MAILGWTHVTNYVDLVRNTSADGLNEADSCRCRPVCGVVLNITYGHKVESVADPLVVNGDKATSNTVNIGGPGSLLVDLIPIRTFP